MGNQQKVERANQTIRRLDRMMNPPQYRDEELPTKMKFIFARAKLGTLLDSNSGVTNMGSVHFSGSHYDAAPGSYSLRITRRNVGAGSMAPMTNAWWYLHHSRLGTIDAIPIQKGGTMTGKVDTARPGETVGGPLNPIYSFGPGTLTQYVRSYAGTLRVAPSMQGFF